MNARKFVNNYYHMGGKIIGGPNSNSLARGSVVIMEESGTGRVGAEGVRREGKVITVYNNHTV